MLRGLHKKSQRNRTLVPTVKQLDDHGATSPFSMSGQA